MRFLLLLFIGYKLSFIDKFLNLLLLVNNLTKLSHEPSSGTVTQFVNKFKKRHKRHNKRLNK